MFQLSFGQNCPSVGHLTTKLTQWEYLLQKYYNWNVPFSRQKTWMEECIQCKSHQQVQTRYCVFFIIPVFAPCLCLFHCLCLSQVCLHNSPVVANTSGTFCFAKNSRRRFEDAMQRSHILFATFAGILSLATIAILLEIRLEICTRDSRVQFLT